MELLIWLEETSLGTWIAESPSLWGYPFILILHGIGLGTVVGFSTMVDLRILGFAPQIPLAPMAKFFPVMWVGFWINFASGGVLMISHATTMWTNWVIYIKFTFIALAMLDVLLLQTQVFRKSDAKLPPLLTNKTVLAAASLFFWAGAISAGRLTAYYG